LLQLRNLTLLFRDSEPMKNAPASCGKLFEQAGDLHSAPTVGRLLQREGFSLQANVETLEGAQHPLAQMRRSPANGTAKIYPGRVN
jgi:hypothetical protein